MASTAKYIRTVRGLRIKSKHKDYVYGLVRYLPKSLINEEVVIIPKKEYDKIESELNRLRSMKILFEHVLNMNNGRKMFNIISKTWNPVTGCLHNCTYCWARRLALTKLKHTKRYRNGFLPRINEEEFKAKFNGEIVFVSDMGDLFGDFIPSEWIIKVIEHTAKYPNTLFLFLTKNPERYHEFLDKFPPNAILGATIETNKDELYLENGISRAPLPSRRYKAMKELQWPLKFISIEPILDFDMDTFVEWIKDINPFMVYVGYDNYNNKLPEPPMKKTEKLIEQLSSFTLVVKKTIRPAWYESMDAYLSDK